MEDDWTTDCNERTPQCGAVCCIIDGKWCEHFDLETRTCTKYDSRPVCCREYRCDNNEFIWEDYENKVVTDRVKNLLVNTSDEPRAKMKLEE